LIPYIHTYTYIQACILHKYPKNILIVTIWHINDIDLEVELRNEAEKRRSSLRAVQRAELETADLRYTTKRDMANTHFKDQQKTFKAAQDAEIAAKRHDWDSMEAAIASDFDERVSPYHIISPYHHISISGAYSVVIVVIVDGIRSTARRRREKGERGDVS
jgi:hypothetical protein